MGHPDAPHARWRKSARSGQNGECVEIALVRGGIAVRDSKDPDGPVLLLPHVTWQQLNQRIRHTA